ncbi:uncharacterized protein LOC143860963 [Tasmannia lanceolata]|uniref:uncharacterized protein LOC143860963 n=1 Tax=Tasmannia lanceolata TaxID=3420 RepID=UPI0040628526
MDEYRRCQIPAFGNWDFSDGLPITQYFESARQAGLLRFHDVGDDFYGEDLKKPTFYPSKLQEKESPKRYQYVKEPKKQGRVCDMTEPQFIPRAPKPVDEDLYKISPELLRRKPRSNRVLGFLTGCLMPHCCTV